MKKLGSQIRGKLKKHGNRKIFGDEKRPRVVFSKSNRYLTVQAVDDAKQHTIAYLCSRELARRTRGLGSTVSKTCKSQETASELGVEFAKDLDKKNIKNIVFDRSRYIYHGKIKVFCDKMREWGINF